MIPWSLLLTATFVQSSPADTLRLLAQRLPESALVLEIRSRPTALRDAVTDALRGAVKSETAPLRAEQLAVARQLAEAYAVGWRDSFLIRQVQRFTSWDSGPRAGKVWADSVRRAGIVAYRQDGPASAILIWRRALRRARAIGDSAGVAALLGNIGAGFLEDGQLDSASVYLERARAMAASLGDVRVEGNAVGMLAGLSADRGNVAAARVQYGQALALRERIDDSRGVAADHNNLGLLAQQLGDLDEAQQRFESALALNRRDGRDDAAATNLINLAGLASLAGDFGRAAAFYRDALATWRAREEWAEAGAALHGLGQLELRRGNYPAAVETLQEAVGIYDRAGPLSDALQVRRELADAFAAEGELQRALEILRRAQQLADSARVPAEARAGIALARADLAMQMNASAEAERLYSRAEFLYRQAGNRTGEAEAQEGRGVLLATRGDFGRAQVLLESAIRAQQASGNQRSAALARLSLAQLSLKRGDTVAARAQLSRSVGDLERVKDPVAAAAALGERAAVEAAGGFATTAESLFNAGLTRLQRRAAPDVAWRLHAGLALALRARGDDDGAARELRAAITEIERASRSLVLAERRSAFLTDKWDVYTQLAMTEEARGRAHAAFDVAERLHAREMLELLGRGRIGRGGPSGTSADLVSREQDLRRRVAELAFAPADASDELREMDAPAPSAVEREGLSRAQDAYAELLLEMKERTPSHALLVAPRSITARDVAERLAPNEAFIEYLVSESGSLVFIVTRDSFAVRDLGAPRRELARLVEFARGTLARPGGGRGSALTDSLWRGPLLQLRQELITPLEETGLLANKTRLILVPHAELHYLPFATLLDSGGQFLVQRYELTTTPSASVWLALGDRPRTPGTGVLALAPRPDALPASRREVESIERRTEGRVLTGAQATEAAFRRDAPGRRVIHVASYGILNKNNPLFSFVQLEAGGGDDGRLEVHEVFGLDLAADLVVLSACQTGLGSGALSDVPPGDDWVGLTRAFLHAGAGTVVATLWSVDDWATAALMEQFYDRYSVQADPVAALAQAQRAMLARTGTTHPFYWAGFVAVGER
jgi:CHAT domain-containing protein